MLLFVSVLLLQFNILSLDPLNPETMPPELLDALEEYVVVAEFQGAATKAGGKETDVQRLKRQMQLDALQPLGHNGPDDDDGPQKKSGEASRDFSADEVQSAREFLGLNVRMRCPSLRRIFRNESCRRSKC